MHFFYLVLGGLATYRLALLLSKENGPGDIIQRLRQTRLNRGALRGLLSCEWCISIWMAALVATYLWWLDLFPGSEWVLYWLALSAFAIICNQQWSCKPQK
jgi:hypothetical protein